MGPKFSFLLPPKFPKGKTPHKFLNKIIPKRGKEWFKKGPYWVNGQIL